MSTNSPKKWLNLEEHFFAQMDQQLLEKLRQEQSDTQSAAAIMKVTGIADEGLAKELASVGITIETLTAFRLVPMVMVAWADDRMEESERDAILLAAQKTGIDSADPAMAMLRSWTRKRPSFELFEAWKHYCKSLSESLNGPEREVLRKQLVEQVTEVARAAGGVLGFGSISANEKAIIDCVNEHLS